MSRTSSYLRTTPGRMASGLVAGIIGALLIAFNGLGAYHDVRDAVQTLGRDTVPSIVAAEKIRFVLADAHASAMNAVLLHEVEGGPSGQAFRNNMNLAHTELLTAAKNITYGDEEQRPIAAIMTALGAYERLLGQAQAKGGEAALADLGAANLLMQKTILPATVALDQANFDHLTTTFQRHRAGFALALAPFIACSLLTLAALLAAQWYVKRRTRRTFNAGLLAATVMLGLTLLYCTSALNGVEKKLVSAKGDAFDSIHALSKARALAYEANADESLLLIYRGHPQAQAQATADYALRTRQIMAIAPAQVASAIVSKAPFSGLLGAELSNITYPGEEAAALRTLKAWGNYMEIDQQIRTLEGAGHFAEAQALTLGKQTGQSDWAFEAFDKALGDTIAINQDAFEHQIAQAFADLTRIPYILLAAVLASIAASIAGMKPRLDEYRF